MNGSWNEFLAAIKRARRGLRFEVGEECLFRGHSQSEWPLLPTLLRHCRAEQKESAQEIRDLEAALFFEFRARARELHGQGTDWDVLFHMRHHGLATRLLDWTEVLGVAVYFALREAGPDAAPCIWLLNPYALNVRSWDVRDFVAPEYLPQGEYGYADYLVDYSKDAGFDWDLPVALYPLQRNARLHAQHAYFTIHGENNRPLEVTAKDVVAKVPLPRAAWGRARDFLESAGINEHLLYPDLDGLTRYLHQKYGIK
jgi:hypothetical protein